MRHARVHKGVALPHPGVLPQPADGCPAGDMEGCAHCQHQTDSHSALHISLLLQVIELSWHSLARK